MKTGWLSCIVSLFSWHIVLVQAPQVLSVSPGKGAADETVTVAGNNFSTNAADLAVWVGASRATIKSTSNQLLEIVVPAGGTYDHIQVTNLPLGLTGYSDRQFLPTYKGEPNITTTDFQTQLDLDATSGLYDLCLCDLDGDQKNDIASVSDNATSFALFRNTSTPGSLTFVRSLVGLGARSLHVKCSDLNGDGKADLIISEGGIGSRIFILKNNSTPGSFSFTQQVVSITGKPKQVETADLDRDGRPEIIVTNQSGGNIIILQNKSSTSTISFDAPLEISITGAASTDGIAVEDFNGDTKPDIAVSQFLVANSNVFILENTGSAGNILFGAPATITLPGTLVNLRAGDLNHDNKPDLAATQLLSASLSVFLNQSSGTIQFGAATTIASDERPWGLDFGDIDGDQQLDVVVASITKKSITVLNNTGTTPLAYQLVSLNTTFINRHVRLGDLDGDAKPEILFTSIDDNNLGIPASKISIIRNRNCFTP